MSVGIWEACLPTWGFLRPWAPQHWRGSDQGPAWHHHTGCSWSSPHPSGQTKGKPPWTLKERHIEKLTSNLHLHNTKWMRIIHQKGTGGITLSWFASRHLQLTLCIFQKATNCGLQDYLLGNSHKLSTYTRAGPGMSSKGVFAEKVGQISSLLLSINTGINIIGTKNMFPSHICWCSGCSRLSSLCFN